MRCTVFQSLKKPIFREDGETATIDISSLCIERFEQDKLIYESMTAFKD
jgi:hypothetical protein